ncbi:MAG: hypothetical protein E6R13_02180 [Spirochaetes bacterium]|nr:MAG: hypothetical protein E6R13_02180 [Spirochaetota bacterium]
MKKYDTPIRDSGTEDDFLLTLQAKLTFQSFLDILYTAIISRAISKRLKLTFSLTIKIAYNEREKGIYSVISITKKENIPIRNMHTFMKFSIPPEVRARVFAWGRANT